VILTAKEDIVLIDANDLKEIDVTPGHDLQLVYHTHFKDIGLTSQTSE